MKKFLSILMAIMMVAMLGITAFAQTVSGTGDYNGSITINNAAKGETYSVYKLFDATINADGSSIAYTGDIPTSLTDYFEKDSAGNIHATDAAKDGDVMSDGLKAALKTWAATATATASALSDGSVLTFEKLPYGYYVVTTTQGEAAISVDSTTPNPSIYDKNATDAVKNLTKTVDDDDVNFTDTVTYTVKFTTSNYDGSDTAAKKVVSYKVEDTLPAFLTNVTVTSIIVDNDADEDTTTDQTDVTAQFTNKTIVINWYDSTNAKFLYDNGALVIITYTATVTDDAAIAGAGNTNTVTVTPNLDDNTTGTPSTANETIYTYALALKKVNDNGVALAGAEFELPFYVNATADTDGAYNYAGTTEADGLTKTVTTPANGEITIKGVASGSYTITETKAPDGYNKLTSSIVVTVEKTAETSTNVTFYIKDGVEVDANTEGAIQVTYTNSNYAVKAALVINKTGSELPSTGGIGTTIFYVVGGILMAGAVVLLVTKKKMSVK